MWLNGFASSRWESTWFLSSKLWNVKETPYTCIKSASSWKSLFSTCLGTYPKKLELVLDLGSPAFSMNSICCSNLDNLPLPFPPGGGLRCYGSLKYLAYWLQGTVHRETVWYRNRKNLDLQLFLWAFAFETCALGSIHERANFEGLCLIEKPCYTRSGGTCLTSFYDETCALDRPHSHCGLYTAFMSGLISS